MGQTLSSTLQSQTIPPTQAQILTFKHCSALFEVCSAAAAAAFDSNRCMEWNRSDVSLQGSDATAPAPIPNPQLQ